MQLDMQALLEPISEDRPTGENLTYDPLYDQIREARRADDPHLPRGVWERDLKKPDWPEVERLCVQGLTKRSKDLQLVGWLLEALVIRHGFEGLAEGLVFLDALCERYWDGIYPGTEDGDHEHRHGLFRWINHNVTVPVTQVALTAPRDPELPVVSFAEWEKVGRQASVAPKRGKTSESVTSLVRIHRALEDTPPSALNSWITALDRSLEVLGRLKTRLDADPIDDPASLQALSDQAQVIREKIMKVFKQRQEHQATPSDGDEPSASAAEEELEAPSNGVIRSREQAYRVLDEIADFLMRTEPHSPTPFLLKRIASWGDMTLFDLLQEVIPATDEQLRIQELFFLKKEEQSE